MTKKIYLDDIDYFIEYSETPINNPSFNDEGKELLHNKIVNNIYRFVPYNTYDGDVIYRKDYINHSSIIALSKKISEIENEPQFMKIYTHDELPF